MRKSILEVRALSKSYELPGGALWRRKRNPVLRDFSMKLSEGEILGIAGPSGAGKSTLLRALVHMEEADSGSIVLDSELIFEKRPGQSPSVNRYSEERVKRKMQMILQDPSSALDPRRRAGSSLIEAAMLCERSLKRREAEERAAELLELCGLGKEYLERYPRELSGGQSQRLCIARALLLRPRLLLCDEISSALDLSVQAKILNLLLDLRERFSLSYIFVSHDRELLDCFCDRELLFP